MVTKQDFVTVLLIALPWSLLIWNLSNGNHMDLYRRATPDGRNDSRSASGDPPCAPGGRAAAEIVEVVRTKHAYRRPPPWSATLVPIYAITATYHRAVQKAELTRMANTFLHVANLHWIVVEDAPDTTDLVGRLLKASGINYTHLHMETPADMKATGSYPRGSIQKNTGLSWLRITMGAATPGVVYFADDDNTYSLELFEEMRSTTMVSVWPVGFAGGRTFEGPQINAQGKVSGWMTAFAPDRQFPIDMAGFAINLQLLIRKSEVVFNLRNVSSGHQESGLLSRLVSVKDLEPKADNCTKVLVWHTKTQNPTLVNEGQRGFSNLEVEI